MVSQLPVELKCEPKQSKFRLPRKFTRPYLPNRAAILGGNTDASIPNPKPLYGPAPI